MNPYVRFSLCKAYAGLCRGIFSKISRKHKNYFTNLNIRLLWDSYPQSHLLAIVPETSRREIAPSFIQKKKASYAALGGFTSVPPVIGLLQLLLIMIYLP